MSSSDPQLGSAPVLVPSLRRTYHLQASMVRKAQGVVTLTAFEYEPGVSKVVESTFGGKCLQVGYDCFILKNLPALKFKLLQTSIS